MKIRFENISKSDKKSRILSFLFVKKEGRLNLGL
jgi:hypothetical protein